MRTTLLVFALAISGMSGSLQASTHHHSATTHKVKRGETAARIARDNGLSLGELTELNPKLNLAKLSVGAVVKVGGSRAPLIHLPAAAVKARSVHPMTPLPGTPALGPASLVHLERVMPVDIRPLPPVQPESADRSALGAANAPALATLRTVVPEAGGDDPVPASLPAPQGFEPADPAKLDMLWPVETRTVSSAWGPRMRSKTVRVKARKRRVRYRGSHKGVDLTAPKGADVFAAMDGLVVASGRHKDYGNFVVLDHGNGVVTLYGHHNRNFIKAGEVVRRGQKIAEVGRTGNATGPHLHFELRVDGRPVNPLPMLNDMEEIPADMVAQNQAAVAPHSSR